MKNTIILLIFLAANTVSAADPAKLKARLIPPDGAKPPKQGMLVLNACERNRTASVPVAVPESGVIEVALPAQCLIGVLRFERFEAVSLKKLGDVGEIALQPEARIEARVVSAPSMEIVPGASVRAVLDRTGPETVFAEGTADENGRIAIGGLPSGVPIAIEARMPGAQRSGSAKIVLEKGERATIDPLVIAQGAKLVLRARLAERFRTAFPEARLAQIAVRSRKGAPEVQRSARVDGTEDVVFDGLTPGTYEMIAIVGIPESTQPIEIATLDLAAGEERRYEAIVDPLVFRGRVSAGGSGAAMQLSIWDDLGGRPARSKPDGDFAIILPKTGTYAVQGFPTTERGRVIEFGNVEFNDPRQPVELRVPNGAVDVVVTDGGKPAVGAQVLAQLQLDGTFRSGPAVRGTLDASGITRFGSLLEGRTWLFEARAEDGRVAEKALVVNGTTPLRIALELQEPVLVGGTVRDHNGTPVNDARVACLYLNADEVPRLTDSERGPEGRYTVTLASTPGAKVRCGVRGATIGTFTTAPSRTADYTLPPPEKSGTLVITNWRHTVRTRNTLWLTNTTGDVFNLDWAGGGAGPAPAALTIAGVPAGRWKIVRVKTLANLAALARGTTVGVEDIETIAIKAGETSKIALDFD